jgi:transcriptional regulator with XRE-family HTH domain
MNIPFEVSDHLRNLGERIRLARIRRQISQDEMAAKCRISRATLQRIEAGYPGCAIGVIYEVLWILGLMASTNDIANPDKDEHGKILEAAKRTKRVRQPKDNFNDNNF